MHGFTRGWGLRFWNQDWQLGGNSIKFKIYIENKNIEIKY